MSASREQDIFAEAIVMPPGARPAFITKACAGDRELRASVESLLAAHLAAGDFFASPVATQIRRNPRPAEAPGDCIGHYRLAAEIGAGGCGVVFRAEQEQPVRRSVALKIIKLGMDTDAVIARFNAERQALALMDHPNIARVFDAGATATGRPYFVMELVHGSRLTDYCDEQRLTPRERLQLFIPVCRAVQHAHQKGIIHRDLKPSNILVTLQDGAPVPKVIDFGIAKATEGRLGDHTVLTSVEQLIGTPAYMSPEQAEGSGDIDTRADIYALGVVLYELLAGQRPFATEATTGADLDAARRRIRERDPARPSTALRTLDPALLRLVAKRRQTEPLRLIQSLRGDLDRIILKCLEPERARRYDSATALAADLERHLNFEPVTARAPSPLYVLGKFFRRHRVVCISGGLVAISLVGGLALSTWLFLGERRMLERARYSEQKTVEAFRAALKQQALASQARARAATGADAKALHTVIDGQLAQLRRELASQPGSLAAALASLAPVYRELGDGAAAEALLREAEQIRTAAAARPKD